MMAAKFSNNLIIGTTVISLGLLMISCDTTEDAYYLGTLDGIHLSLSPGQRLELAADGKEQVINVTSNVYWYVETESDPHFTVKALTDKGNGSIVVSAQPNFNKDEETLPTKVITVTARDIDRSVSVEVVQANLSFMMEEGKTYPEVPEVGGDVEIKFKSSIDWYLATEGGESGWLVFNPADYGSGKWGETKVIAEWTPNYTLSPRSVNLQLSPANVELEKYLSTPSAITLTQAAGTLPYDLGISLEGNPGGTECPLSIRFKSKAPIEECGVILSGNGQEMRFPATSSSGDFPNSGEVKVEVTSLRPLTLYTASPFVRSKVGEVVGNTSVTFTTGSNATWTGASINEVLITPTYNAVKAVITVDSDCDLVQGGIYIYDNEGQELVKYSDQLSGKTQSFKCQSIEFLNQNTEYALRAFAVYSDPERGNVEVRSDLKPFRTTYRTPTEDDNSPIE